MKGFDQADSSAAFTAAPYQPSVASPPPTVGVTPVAAPGAPAAVPAVAAPPSAGALFALAAGTSVAGAGCRRR